MNDAPVEHVSKSCRKFVGQTWLDEEAGTALTLGAFSQRSFVVTGQQNDGNRSSSCLGLQIVKQLPAVAATQRQVRYDDVRVRIPSLAVSLVRVGRRDCVESESRKALDIQLARVVMIVDDEHQRP